MDIKMLGLTNLGYSNKFSGGTANTDKIFENMLQGEMNNFALGDIFKEAALKYNLPEQLLLSVAKVESGFNTRAESKSGAAGVMQLMPATAEYLGVTDVFDARQNIMAGGKYLRMMLDKFDGNLEYALAAYNAGEGNVRKYNGIPPFEETQNYVAKVMSLMGSSDTQAVGNNELFDDGVLQAKALNIGLDLLTIGSIRSLKGYID